MRLIGVSIKAEINPKNLTGNSVREIWKKQISLQSSIQYLL